MKFSAMGPLTTALQTCKEFVTVIAPLVPIREMDGNSGSTVVATDTSTRDKTSTRGMESDSQSGMGYEFPDSQAVSASQTEAAQGMDISLPLQPDESNLIPVPDLAKVNSYVEVVAIFLLFCTAASKPEQVSWKSVFRY